MRRFRARIWWNGNPSGGRTHSRIRKFRPGRTGSTVEWSASGKDSDMAERVRFYFDPICPWCYQTSRWARRVEQLGLIELDWALFSLELQNAGKEPEDLARAHARSARGLRTAIAVRDDAGPVAVGAFYAALGVRFHQHGEPLDEPATVEAALADAGLDAGLCARAWADPSTTLRVAAEHRELSEGKRGFGVPTIVLDGGDGPAMFGPVISEVPNDDDAVQLWRHVSWLVRHANFAELKRDRVAAPELESIRRSG
jgi:predicted DsbA family dithiol-disulfide isomerase